MYKIFGHFHEEKTPNFLPQKTAILPQKTAFSELDLFLDRFLTILF